MIKLIEFPSVLGRNRIISYLQQEDPSNKRDAFRQVIDKKVVKLHTIISYVESLIGVHKETKTDSTFGMLSRMCRVLNYKVRQIQPITG